MTERNVRVCDFCGRDYGLGEPVVFEGNFLVVEADKKPAGKRVMVVMSDKPAGRQLDGHPGCVLSFVVATLMEDGILHPAWLAEYLTGIPADKIGGDILVTPETLKIIGITGKAQKIERSKE